MAKVLFCCPVDGYHQAQADQYARMRELAGEMGASVFRGMAPASAIPDLDRLRRWAKIQVENNWVQVQEFSWRIPWAEVPAWATLYPSRLWDCYSPDAWCQRPPMDACMARTRYAAVNHSIYRGFIKDYGGDPDKLAVITCTGEPRDVILPDKGPMIQQPRAYLLGDEQYRADSMFYEREAYMAKALRAAFPTSTILTGTMHGQASAIGPMVKHYFAELGYRGVQGKTFNGVAFNSYHNLHGVPLESRIDYDDPAKYAAAHMASFGDILAAIRKTTKSAKPWCLETAVSPKRDRLSMTPEMYWEYTKALFALAAKDTRFETIGLYQPVQTKAGAPIGDIEDGGLIPLIQETKQ